MPYDQDLSESVFTFGKHKGRTFIDVYNNDLNYVNWIKSLVEPNGKVLDFCNFIKNYEMCKKTNNIQQQQQPPSAAASGPLAYQADIMKCFISDPAFSGTKPVLERSISNPDSSAHPTAESMSRLSTNAAVDLREEAIRNSQTPTRINGSLNGNHPTTLNGQKVTNGATIMNGNNTIIPNGQQKITNCASILNGNRHTVTNEQYMGESVVLRQNPSPVAMRGTTSSIMDCDLENKMEVRTPVRARPNIYTGVDSGNRSGDYGEASSKRVKLAMNPLSDDGGRVNSLRSEYEYQSVLQKEEDVCAMKRIELDGVLALVVYSESEFYLEYCKNVKSGFTKWTCYIPLQVFDYLNSLGFESSTRILGKERCITYKSSDYKLILKNLYKIIQDRHMLEPIPNFILRTFPEFSKFSRDYDLPSRTALSLFGLQTPHGRTNYGNISRYIGEELYRELKPFQREGIEFGIMKNGRVLIGDEMGLGKTLQALGISAFYSIDWPLLIVCPSSLRFQWRDQCRRWLPHLIEDEEDICVIKSGKNQVPDDIKIVIISYDLLSQHERFRSDYSIIICDESHYLKNRSAKRTKTIVPLLKNAKRVILLSGTPALNIPSELYEQLSCLMPCFSSSGIFVERYCEKRMNWYTKKMEYVGSKHTHELHLFLVKTVMIRRLKENVLHELPPKIRTKIPIELPASFVKSCKASLELRDKITTAQDFEEDFKSFQDIFKLTGEAKCKGVCDYIIHLLNNGTKFLVFAHHRFVMDAIEVILKDKRVNYIRIDGSTPIDKREVYVKKFQTEEECTVAILSLTACGTGLNLTASSMVVFAELFWVPGQMIQAEDRVHRLGTKHTIINIHYLIAENSVEETVWRVINRKWETVTSTLNGETSNISLKEKLKNQHTITKLYLDNNKAR